LFEEEVVKVLDSENDEFKSLHKEHRGLKEKLAEFNSKVYLTPDEEVEKMTMKKLKLAKKDRMAQIIREYKQSNA
jgi:uncharacterized protein YdcH (DUF465 family)